MPKKKYVIELSEGQKKIIEKMARATSIRADLKERATIILRAHQGKGNNEICKELSVYSECVWKWKKRYAEAEDTLSAIEKDEPDKLQDTITELLRDRPRSGAPRTFTDAQFAQIIALSLKAPESVGVPISHWTPGALAQKAMEARIVDSISPTQIWRFLKKKPI